MRLTAAVRSVPNSYSTWTVDEPSRVVDRTSDRPGMPVMAVSMGSVTCRSTTSGAAPG